MRLFSFFNRTAWLGFRDRLLAAAARRLLVGMQLDVGFTLQPLRTHAFVHVIVRSANAQALTVPLTVLSGAPIPVKGSNLELLLPEDLGPVEWTLPEYAFACDWYSTPRGDVKPSWRKWLPPFQRLLR